MENIGKKYRVMIIDDDLLVVDDMKALVDWDDLNLEIVSICENGKKALEQLPKVKPNIVIADIAMPLVDGLEFSEKALQYDKSIKIILLTAYSKFEYVKKAISLGVVNYILKHELDEELLKNELLKMKSALDDEFKGAVLRKRKALEDFLSNPYSDFYKEQFENNIFSIKGMQKSYFIAINKCFNGNLDEITDNMYSKILTLKCIGEENKSLSAIFIPVSKVTVVAMIYSKACILSENLFNQMVFNFSSQIKEEFKAVLNENVNIFISSICTNANDIIYAFKKVCEISKYSFFMQSTGVFHCIDIESRISSGGINVNDKLRLRELQYESDINKIRVVVNDIWQKYCVKKYDMQGLKELCEELRAVLSNKNKLFNIGLGKSEEFSLKCNECKNADEILKLFYKEINEIDDYRREGYSYKTAAVIEFIHKEYAKQITIDDIANELGVSGEYLSKYFKKEFKQSFTKYLTEYRMKVAKELLESGNFKIYEVSEMVGYNTTQYFSSIFKKVNGKMPSDYIR